MKQIVGYVRVSTRRQGASGLGIEDRTAYDLISSVRGCVREEDRARIILDQLIAIQQLSPATGQHTLSALRELGVIDRGVWGVHPISRQYLRAIKLLRTFPGFFFPSGDKCVRPVES